MEVEAVGAVPSPRRPVQPVGVTAEMAKARAKLREVAPSNRWDAVLDEVSRLQREEQLSPLAAMQAVFARLASGWVPPVSR